MIWSFPCGSVGKESACNVETWVQYLGWEDPLEKEMATHSNILSWRIPWMEEPGRQQSTGSQRVRHDWATSLMTWFVVYTLFYFAIVNLYFILPCIGQYDIIYFIDL